MSSLRRFYLALDELIFPKRKVCPLCKERPSLVITVCQACLDSLAIIWKKGTIQDRPYFSLFPYQGFARDLIHSMKYQNGYELAQVFGYFLGLAAQEEFALQKTDVLVPVPLSAERLEQRGFNQAMLLADTISTVWKRPITKNVIRIRNTKPQSELSNQKRKVNLDGAFAVLPGFNLKNKHCLIIDDVITSGHTFASLAQVIEGYGGYPLGLFLARTEITKEWSHAEELRRV